MKASIKSVSYIIIMIIAECIFANRAMTQTLAADNKPFQTITFRPIPEGPSIVGVFEGRPPCRELARQLGLQTDPDCEKLKWNIVFYRDPVSQKRTTYTLSIVGSGELIKQEGSSYRWQQIKGRWESLKGIAPYPEMEVYRLQLNNRGNDLYLLKGDNNVLFILNKDKSVMTGNEDFSFTLNRVELVAGKK